MNNPGISKKAFWDTPDEKLDFDQHRDYIIARIFEYGTWEDMQTITRYYGTEQVIKSVCGHPFFYPDTLSFISTIFNIPKEQMICSGSRPYRQTAGPYSTN